MWYYENKPFTPIDEDIKDFVGFVYLITDKSNGKKYVGKKLFWSKIKRPPLKGKKRKRVSTVQSDWMKYYSSNGIIMEGAKEDPDRFHREILHFCKSKGELSYMELKEQMDRGVLFSEDYYNGIIQVRINASHVKGMKNE
jgi:hypothetical protein